MVWLHFHGLFALSKVWSTLVFAPYVKDVAVLRTQKDTSLFTRQKAGDVAACCFSGFVTCGERDLPLSRRCPAPHAGHRLALARLQSCAVLAVEVALPRLAARLSGGCEPRCCRCRVETTAANAELVPPRHLSRTALAQLLHKPQLVYLQLLLKCTGIHQKMGWSCRLILPVSMLDTELASLPVANPSLDCI